MDRVRPNRRTPPSPAGAREHASALLMSAALAAFMLFVRNPSADDVYYVNRSAWVAERGSFPLQDTMFGPEKHPTPYGSGLPVTSIEELLGALAHLLGVEGASVVYLVAMPVFVLMSGWVTWRLVESWAARSRLLVLALALRPPAVRGHRAGRRLRPGAHVAGQGDRARCPRAVRLVAPHEARAAPGPTVAARWWCSASSVSPGAV